MNFLSQVDEVDQNEIPAKRKRSSDSYYDEKEVSSPPSLGDKPGSIINNNNNSINNNNIHSKRSMDHVLKKLTFKMMRDELESPTEDQLPG